MKDLCLGPEVLPRDHDKAEFHGQGQGMTSYEGCDRTGGGKNYLKNAFPVTLLAHYYFAAASLEIRFQALSKQHPVSIGHPNSSCSSKALLVPWSHAKVRILNPSLCTCT